VISWWIFAAAGTGALIITLLTVSYQAIKAAMANSGEEFENGMSEAASCELRAARPIVMLHSLVSQLVAHSSQLASAWHNFYTLYYARFIRS